MKQGRWTILITTISIVLLSAVGLSLYGYQLQLKEKNKPLEAAAKVQQQHVQQLLQEAAIFQQVPLRAQGVYIQNLSSHDIVYEKNADAALPLASLTKIMTAYVALEHIDPATPIIFSQNAIAQTGDQGFAEGEQWELKKLIPFMMTTSSNDAAYAIAEAVEQSTGTSCLVLMNKTAQEHDIASLVFRNVTGLDTTDNAGTLQTNATGNARDVAKLFYMATQKYPDIFTNSSVPNISLGNHNGANTNILTESIPGFLVSKTGYTDTAQGNLAFIVEIGPNQPYMVVLLGSTYSGRFADAKKIIDTLYRVVTQKRIGV